jgi:hypothetical protein
MPSATIIITIIITIAPVVSIADANVYTRHVDINALRLNGGSRSKCRRADKAQRNSCFQ